MHKINYPDISQEAGNRYGTCLTRILVPNYQISKFNGWLPIYIHITLPSLDRTRFLLGTAEQVYSNRESCRKIGKVFEDLEFLFLCSSTSTHTVLYTECPMSFSWSPDYVERRFLLKMLSSSTSRWEVLHMGFLFYLACFSTLNSSTCNKHIIEQLKNILSERKNVSQYLDQHQHSTSIY